MGTASVAGEAAFALDATPNPTGVTIFYTAYDPTAGPGVFSVPADGSMATTPKTVQAGAPFAAPFGITISTDGTQLFVADPGATDTTSNQDLGVVFVLPTAGGTPTILSGSVLTEARGVQIHQESGADVLYFTGRDRATGAVGVFKIPAAGGAITVVAEGAPFNDPSGIAIASDGTVYVADTVASGSHTANVFAVKGGTAAPFLTDLRVGYPAGLAVSGDDKTLFLSSLDPATKTDQILQIDVATQTPTPLVPAAIMGNTEAAGIHRAHAAEVYAWADTSAGPNGGRVFTIK
jgi:sugar lactone lactonase YvrE